MVEHRVSQGDMESRDFYDCQQGQAPVPNDGLVSDDEEPRVDPALLSVLREEQRIGRASQKLQDLRDKGVPTYHRATAEAVERIAFLPQRMRVVQRQWEHLTIVESTSVCDLPLLMN